MEKKKEFWTLRYALINIFYFVSFCTIHAFASVYLLDRGFSNTEIGLLLAIANVVSAVLQPYVAGLIDKPGPFTNRNVTMGSSALILLGSLALLFVRNSRIIIFVIFMLIYMIQFVYQPVITALVFEYQKAGANIFYGLARGLGSAGFAIASVFMGNLVASYGVSILFSITVADMLILIVMAYFFKKPEGTAVTEEGKDPEPTGVAHNNILEFAKLYPVFMLLLLATVLMFFGHNMVNDYMIQIITPIGGTERELGYAVFLAAILELPAMSLITMIIKKVSPEKLLILSGIFFSIKVLIMLFAVNMTWVYASQACQMLAYAVFIPSAAYYVDSHLQPLDQVKGQAFITSGLTLGGFFSGLVCGPILDTVGVKTMLIVGLLVSIVGTATLIFAMTRRGQEV